MGRPSAFSSYPNYILGDATWTGTAPLNSTYELAQFAAMHPDWRVKFGSTTVTVTATLGSSKKADVVAIAGSNIDPLTTKLHLTNGSGLNAIVPVPTVPADGIPLTAVLDLRPLASAGVRTSNVWNWVITGNSVNVVLMALLWLGTLDDFYFEYGLDVEEEHLVDTQENKAGTINIVNWLQRRRWVDFTSPADETLRDKIIEWKRGSYGLAIPSLLWPNTLVNDCLLGHFPKQIGSKEQAIGYTPVSSTFTEFAKGIPLL